jgi:hypothetical protein
MLRGNDEKIAEKYNKGERKKGTKE